MPVYALQQIHTGQLLDQKFEGYIRLGRYVLFHLTAHYSVRKTPCSLTRDKPTLSLKYLVIFPSQAFPRVK